MDDKAVSPVIATILLVAMVVILTALLWAVLSTFANESLSSLEGMSTQPHATPQGDNHTSNPPGNPPHKEEKWSVEPLPGYECTYQVVGIADYLCTR